MSEITDLKKVFPNTVSATEMPERIPDTELGLGSFKTINLGTGEHSLRADKDGFWLGADKFVNAPFSVNMEGAMIATSATITGSVTATTGAIGGWTLAATTLTGGNATLSSTGFLNLGTSNDIVKLSAVNATYRMWAGHATAASAPFRLTKAGALTATSATITGSITSTSGTIGGWTLAATTLTGTNVTLSSGGDLTLGTGNDVVRLSSLDGTYVLWAGHATAASAPFRVTEAGAVTMTSATITGAITCGVGSTYTGTAISQAYIGNLSAAKITTGTLTARDVQTHADSETGIKILTSNYSTLSNGYLEFWDGTADAGIIYYRNSDANFYVEGGDWIVSANLSCDKITRNTEDPILKIDDEFYSTYTADYNGQRCVYVVRKLIESGSVELDFDDEDLFVWKRSVLFDDRISVLLTPEQNVKVWYSLNIEHKKITIHTDSNLPVHVTVQLTGYRIDSDTLPTRYSDKTVPPIFIDVDEYDRSPNISRKDHIKKVRSIVSSLKKRFDKDGIDFSTLEGKQKLKAELSKPKIAKLLDK